MTQVRPDLLPFFHPRSVAVVGALDPHPDPAEFARQQAALWGPDFHLVNPRGGHVGEVPIYPRVTDIPGPVDLAVIRVGAARVAEVITACGAKGIPAAIVYSSGFSETGPEGAALEDELRDAVRAAGVRVLGPNTNTNSLQALADPPTLRGGRIALVTQSGHQGRPIVQGVEIGAAFSGWAPTGNEVDLEASDFIEYFASDDDTAVIAGYFEGFGDVDRLRHALGVANRSGTPLVALKIGRSDAGASMALSHTGHLAASDAVVDGLFRQHGVTRVGDLDELLETANLFSKLPPDTGPSVCCYSLSGGSSALMAEIAAESGVPLPRLGDQVQAQLHRFLPTYLTVSNPVDNGGKFLSIAPEEDRLAVLGLMAADPAVDVLLVGLTAPMGLGTDRLAADLIAFADRSPVPVVVTWNSPKTDVDAYRQIVASGIPVFRSFRNCFQALRAFADHRAARARFRDRPPLLTGTPELPASVAAAEGTLATGPTRDLLAAFGIPTTQDVLATSAADAARAAATLGGPLVMKVASADIPHKTELGLVRLDVRSEAGAAEVFDELARRAADHGHPDIDGVLVQRQRVDGVEILVGISTDPVVGHALLVGSGGIYAEVWKDVSIRPLPVDREDVVDMITALRAHPLLAGARGRAPLAVDALVDLVLATARLAEALGPRLGELDLNPVIVDRSEAVAVDALVVLRP